MPHGVLIRSGVSICEDTVFNNYPSRGLQGVLFPKIFIFTMDIMIDSNCDILFEVPQYRQALVGNFLRPSAFLL